MASSMQPMPNYVYLIIRLNMSDTANSAPGGFLCHYGENDDVFHTGGLVQSDETLMGTAIRHCRHLVNYHVRPNDRSYLAKMLNGFMNYEPLKICIYVTDVP